MRADTLEIPLWRGAAFPATPLEGRLFYRTDLDVAFWYDATRTAWLGELEADGGGYDGAMAGAGYLHRHGGAMAAGIGVYLPYAVVVTGVSFTVAAGVAGNFEIRRAGVSIASISHATATGSDMTLNAAFAAAATLSIYNSAGAITDPQVRVWWRRSAT